MKIDPQINEPSLMTHSQIWLNSLTKANIYTFISLIILQMLHLFFLIKKVIHQKMLRCKNVQNFYFYVCMDANVNRWKKWVGENMYMYACACVQSTLYFSIQIYWPGTSTLNLKCWYWTVRRNMHRTHFWEVGGGGRWKWLFKLTLICQENAWNSDS